jgi:hypothetical protein
MQRCAQRAGDTKLTVVVTRYKLELSVLEMSASTVSQWMAGHIYAIF